MLTLILRDGVQAGLVFPALPRPEPPLQRGQRRQDDPRRYQGLVDTHRASQTKGIHAITGLWTLLTVLLLLVFLQ